MRSVRRRPGLTLRGKDFILTAKMLCRENCREPEWRTSISRSYYAAYHTIRECLSAGVERALLIRSGGTALYHGFVIRCLKRCSDEKVNEIGDLLNDLRAERRRADYDLHDKIESTRAVDVLSDASDLLIEMDSFDPEAVASSVSDLLKRSPYGL